MSDIKPGDLVLRNGRAEHDATAADYARFDRFIEADANSGCWLWSGSASGRENALYGHFCLRGKQVKAARFALERSIGKLRQLEVTRHKCDVSLCVNPAHLEPGSHADNISDREKRGRGKRIFGEFHANAKLTEATVYEVRQAHKAGEKQTAIMRRLALPRHLVRGALNEWRHLERIP